jgi:hypothetical protein
MALTLSREERGALRGVLDQVAELLDVSTPVESTAELEILALEAMRPLSNPEAPAEAAALLIGAIEDRGNEVAAGVLGALAVLGPTPLARFAADSQAHLAASGIVSGLANGIGEIRARACWFAEVNGDSEVLWALLERDRDPRTQAAILELDHLACGDVILDGVLTVPTERGTHPRILEDTVRDHAPQPISRIATIARVSGALDHMIDHEIGLPEDSVPALVLLERALTGQTYRWPRPAWEPWSPPETISDEEGWLDPVDPLTYTAPLKRTRRDRRGKRRAARAARKRNRR